MKNLGSMLKQAQAMQGKMQEMQARLAEQEVQGASGGGMVQVTMNGRGEVKRLKLDKVVVDPTEVEVLEDLVVAALADAKGKVEAMMADEMGKITGGLGLPGGLKLPF